MPRSQRSCGSPWSMVNIFTTSTSKSRPRGQKRASVFKGKDHPNRAESGGRIRGLWRGAQRVFALQRDRAELLPEGDDGDGGRTPIKDALHEGRS